MTRVPAVVRSLLCLMVMAGLAGCESMAIPTPKTSVDAGTPSGDERTGAGTMSKSSDGAAAPLSCSALQGTAVAAIVAAAESVQQCTTDADCRPLEVSVGSTCTDCLYLAGNAQVSAAIKAKAAAIEQLCADFAGAGCKLSPSGCPGVIGWDCVQGKCRPATTVHGDAPALPSCSWPAAFNPGPDAPAGTCRAARLYLQCRLGPDAFAECASNDPTTCPLPSPVPGATYSNCHDQCEPGEYALACGGIGPGPWPQPPPTCRMLPGNPGGGSIACCPCGP
jgi:hypothetical protein